ncbi:tetratricopeptide repeat protein [Methylobacterium oryzae]
MAALLDELTELVSVSPGRRWLRGGGAYSAGQLAAMIFVSVPHWLDRDVFVELRNELGGRTPDEVLAEVTNLRLVRRHRGDVLAAEKVARTMLLNALARDAPDVFARLSDAYAGAFGRREPGFGARLEQLYHGVAADPPHGCAELLRAAVTWGSDPYFETGAVADLTGRLQEQVDRGVAAAAGMRYLALCRTYLPGGAAAADADTLRSALAHEIDPLFQGEATIRVGAVDLKAGHVETALAAFDSAFSIFKGIGDERGCGEALWRRAGALVRLDMYDAAAGSYEAAAVAFDRVGGSVRKAHCVKGMADIELYRGRLGEAAGGFERALAFFAPTNARMGEASTRVAYANLKILRGRLDEALSDIKSALAVYEAVDEELGIGNCLQATGKIEFERGDFSRALDMFTEARSMFEAARRRSSIINASFLQGASLTQLGRPDAALPLIEEALQGATDIGDRGARAWGLRQLGLAMEKVGALGEALTALADSARGFDELGDPVEGSITGLALVRVARSLGFPDPFDTEDAKSRVNTASRLFEEADMPRYLWQAKELAGTLAPRPANPIGFAFDG